MDLGNCMAKIDGDKLILLQPSEDSGIPSQIVIEGNSHLMELRELLMDYFEDESLNIHADTSDEVDAQIALLLQDLDIPSHIRGYQYFREAISIALYEPQSIHSLNKCIYIPIAEKYKTTPQRVERAMRHSVDVAWSQDSGIMKRYFRRRPNNSELISKLSMKIKFSSALGRQIMTS